jgi:hypothetical protein
MKKKLKTENMGRSKIIEKAKKTPHFRNINMDPSLCGTVLILLESEGSKKIGLNQADIVLKGVG